MSTPVNLIAGPLGAGKTTTLHQLLRQRPSQERWAVVVNELGEIGIDGAWLASSGGSIREVPGGCVCCTAQLQLRSTLIELLRQVRPTRLLIEPTGVGHPAGVIDALRAPELASALELRTVVTVVDAGGHSEDRLQRSETYADLLQLADVVLINQVDRAEPERLAAVRAYVDGLYPPKQACLETRFGWLDPGWLDRPHGNPPMPGEAAAHTEPHDHAVAPEPVPAKAAEAALGERQEAHAAGYRTVGWRFPPTVRFRRPALDHLGADLRAYPLVRAKGVFRTGPNWQLFQWTPETDRVEAIAYRGESRFEVILPEAAPFDRDRFEQMLNDIQQPASSATG